MSEDISKILQNAKAPSPVTSLKSSKREEFLSKLTSLLTMAFQEVTNTKQNEKLRQKWFTICGYLTQVGARVVTDLEYEKLRAEVQELKKQVEGKNVSHPRRTITSPPAGASKKIARKRNS